jgi:hypothetical protein
MLESLPRHGPQPSEAIRAGRGFPAGADKRHVVFPPESDLMCDGLEDHLGAAVDLVETRQSEQDPHAVIVARGAELVRWMGASDLPTARRVR